MYLSIAMLPLLFISIEDIFLLNMKATIERLHNKLESLVANYQQLNEELKASNQKVDFLSKQLDEHNQTIQQLNEKNKVLKLSSSIQGEQGDNKEAKQKINELVREIDKCIALLNK